MEGTRRRLAVMPKINMKIENEQLQIHCFDSFELTFLSLITIDNGTSVKVGGTLQVAGANTDRHEEHFFWSASNKFRREPIPRRVDRALPCRAALPFSFSSGGPHLPAFIPFLTRRT